MSKIIFHSKLTSLTRSGFDLVVSSTKYTNVKLFFSLNGAPRITSLEVDSIVREHAKVPHLEWAHPLKRVAAWKTFQRSATRRQIMTRAVGTMDSMQLATIGMVTESRLDFIPRKKNTSITDLTAHHKHAAKMVL